MAVKLRLAKELYRVPRFWYHVSTTLKRKKELLTPRKNDEGFNRCDTEPDVKRICVAPTLEQCLTAVPYGKYDIISIYRTQKKVVAKKSHGVFDSEITQEGWITSPTVFIKMGSISMLKVKNKTKLITEAATVGNIQSSQHAYKWWVKFNPWQIVDYEKGIKKRT